MAAFFTFPAEAFAETFLAEGALVVPTLGEAARGAAALGAIVEGAALPSEIRAVSNMVGRTRSGREFQGINDYPSTRQRIGEPRAPYPPDVSNRPALPNLPDRDHPDPAPAPRRRINSGEAMAGRPATDGAEVAVQPVPKSIALTAPDYFTINLPYADYHHMPAVTASAAGVNRIYRLNSVFDPSTLATVHQPLGRDSWANIYDFYRVVHTSVKLTFINLSDVTPGDVTGSDTVVFGWEEVDDIAAIVTTRTALMERKHADHRIVPGCDRGNLNNGVVMEYAYSPLSWDNHVHETGVEERWTPINATPVQSHLLCVHMIPAKVGTTPSNMNYELAVEIKYTVQFREVKTALLTTNDGAIE